MSLRALYEFVAIIILSIIYVFVPVGADDAIIVMCLAVFYGYLYESLKSPVVISLIPTFFKIDLLFLLFYFLLLYYPYQTFLFGSDSIKTNVWLVNTYWQYSNKAIILTTIGLISFMVGLKWKISKVNLKAGREYSNRQYRLMYDSLLVITLVLFGVYFQSNWKNSLFSAYTTSDTGDSSVDGIGALLLVFMVVMAGFTIFYYSRFKEIRVTCYLFLILGFLYCAFLLIEGNRNVFFIYAVALAGGYYTYIKTISRKQLLIYAIGALFLYQVIEISRKAETRGIGAIVDVITGQADIRASSTVGTDVDEGSFSLTNIGVRAAIYHVPDNHNFFFGKFKLIGFASVIPFARGMIVNPSDPYISSSRYLTKAVGSDFGIGTSIIADSYMEFGLIGVVFLLYILGRIGCFVQYRAAKDQGSLKWMIVYLIVLSNYSEISRYSFDFITKNIGWAFIILYVLGTVFKPKFQEKVSRNSYNLPQSK